MRETHMDYNDESQGAWPLLIVGAGGMIWRAFETPGHQRQRTRES